MKRAVAAFICATALVPSIFAAERPNVLVICIDDLNDWIGCLKGHSQALTPNIDRLAKRGILFTNAHCVAPACNPSRAAIMSGKLPAHTGVWSNKSKKIHHAHPKMEFLPRAFSKAGYRTLGTGKVFHSNNVKGIFDTYYSTEQRWSPLTKKSVNYTKTELPSKGTDSPRHVVNHNGKTYTLPLNRMPSDRNPGKVGGESFDWGPFDVPDGEFGDTRITDWASKQLKVKSDKPFFMCVGYYRPHIPLWAPKRFFDRFKKEPAQLPPVKEDDLADLSATGRKWALEAVTAGSHATVVKYKQWRQAVEAYLACVTYVDYEIGRLLDGLAKSPYAENTTIVLWSDHGWQLGEKQHWGKWTGWERSTRTPLMVVPSKTTANSFSPPGTSCHQPVSLLDLYPTLVELCGLKPSMKLDGQSLVSLLQKPSTETGRKIVTYFNRGNVAVRSKQWRYIRYSDGSEELYDMKADPNEWHNLAGKSEYDPIKGGMR